jgi:hypothetical protein
MGCEASCRLNLKWVYSDFERVVADCRARTSWFQDETNHAIALVPVLLDLGEVRFFEEHALGQAITQPVL